MSTGRGTEANRRAIEALIFTYTERLDRTDFGAVGALFEHGRYGLRGRQVQGATAVTQRLRRGIRRHAGYPRTMHVTTNVAIDVDESAGIVSARSYWTVLPATPELSLQPIGCGRYLDAFERAGAEWRFASREIVIDLHGDGSQHVVSAAARKASGP